MGDMDISDDVVTNRSGNRPFADVLAKRASRRDVLFGATAAATTAFLSGTAASVLGAPNAGAGSTWAASRAGLLGFQALPPSLSDRIDVPPGYTAQAILPWGDPIVPGGPSFLKDASNSAADQALQLGMGHDGMAYFDRDADPVKGSQRGLLVLNHEYTIGDQLFPDGRENWDADKTMKEQNAHGVSVVEIELVDGRWRTIDSRYARRITARTPMRLTGPAAGHRLTKTDLDLSGVSVLGTVNNCANGQTPWGTYLTCEENFNGYFHDTETTDRTPEQQALFDRYGVGGEGFGYQWATTDDNWRADRHPNQPNKFGWIVEIDPFRPKSTPKKHTMLGRFKHENAEVVISQQTGQIAVYLGDDGRFEYCYKYVSSGPWRQMLDDGKNPLTDGTLYVARFDDDGTGEWMPLVHGVGPLTTTNGFADQGEVLIKARLAGDALGATPMDRPEWAAVHPTRDVFWCMTNNTRRTEPNAANPRVENAYGHILKLVERNSDNTATSFEWEIFMLAGAGDGSDGSTVPSDAAFGSPDGLAFDEDGRLFIQTDGRQPIECNDQMLVADTFTGEVKRFLVGVPDCEITGAAITPDQTTMFINVQHPGDSGGPDNPTETSTWPDGDPTSRPRPATVAIRRADGGKIGT